MGRHQKVTVQEVLERLEENGAITIGSLAQQFEVSEPTMRSRIREARKDGESIIHSTNGVQLIRKEDLTDPLIAEAMRSFTNWILSCVKGQMIMANPVQPLLPAMGRALKDNMSAGERRQLAKSCTTVRALIDLVEVDEEMQ
jgi:hypothetical protein